MRELPAELRRRVRSVGLTGQMHGVVLLDAAGEPVSPLVTWQDGRSLEKGFLDDLASRSGYVLSTGFGGATLAWLIRHGAMPARAVSAGTIQDVAVARLCGQARPVTDPTDAASWGLFDLRMLTWDVEAFAAAGIPPGLLPEVRPCGSPAGNLSPAMAESLGLPAGVPVTVAIGDNQASLLATLREPETEIALTLGTGAQVSAVLGAGAAIDWAARASTFEYRPYPGGRYAVVAASLCGGAAWAWLADAANSWTRELGLEPLPRNRVFERLNELGLAATGEIAVRPHFLGERHDPRLRGSIERLDLSGFDLGRLARGLARGILGNLRQMLPPWALHGRARIVGSGNALRRNPLLQRTAEEAFGLPLRLTEGREEAALGAAILSVPV